MMKKKTLVLSVLTLALGASLSRAADEPSSAQQNPAVTGSAPSESANPAPAAIGTPQAAPEGWTSLKGTVQFVDATSKTVQIKDETGSVIQVPVDKQVSIQKEGKSIKLSQLQTGDSIVLAKRPMTPAEQEKSRTY